MFGMMGHVSSMAFESMWEHQHHAQRLPIRGGRVSAVLIEEDPRKDLIFCSTTALYDIMTHVWIENEGVGRD